jgi:hypothetical protein
LRRHVLTKQCLKLCLSIHYLFAFFCGFPARVTLAEMLLFE